LCGMPLGSDEEDRWASFLDRPLPIVLKYRIKDNNDFIVDNERGWLKPKLLLLLFGNQCTLMVGFHDPDDEGKKRHGWWVAGRSVRLSVSHWPHFAFGSISELWFN
jgi:hypothetical protein